MVSHLQVLTSPLVRSALGTGFAFLASLAGSFFLASEAIAQTSCVPLRLGDSGEEVRQLQAILTLQGYDTGEINGSFDSMTEEAVIEFQNDNNLIPTGVVEATTCNALNDQAMQGIETADLSSDYTYSSTVISERDLELDDVGTDVEALQTALRSRGFAIESTGIFDEHTENVVAKFQQIEGLPVTGIADQATIARLQYAPSDTVADSTDTADATTTDVEFSGAEASYTVVIPLRDEDILPQVQQFVPNATIRNSHRGFYVDAGAYSSRNNAESLSSALRARGLDARVVYLR